MEIKTTLPPGGGDHEDHGAVVRVLPAVDVSERPVDEGGNDLDEGETEKGKPQKWDEAPPGLGADESSSIENEGALEQIQYPLRDLGKIMEQLGNLRKYQAASSA